MWADDGSAAIDWEFLYQAHREALRRLIARRVPRNGPVDDILHETFARAIRSAHLIDTQRQPWPFLATVAGRAVADWWQREGARPYGEQTTTAVTEDFPGSDEHASALDRAVAARQALLAMKPRHRRVLYLYEAGDWSYETLTEAEQVSVKAMKSLLARARGCFQDRYRELLAGDTAFGLVTWCRTASRRLRLRLHPTTTTLALEGMLALGGVVVAGVLAGVAASQPELTLSARAANSLASGSIALPSTAPTLRPTGARPETAHQSEPDIRSASEEAAPISGSPSPPLLGAGGGIVNDKQSSSMAFWITYETPIVHDRITLGTETRCDQGEVARQKCQLIRSGNEMTGQGAVYHNSR